MKVEIKVPFGNLSLELTDRQALALIHQATTYAVDNVAPCTGEQAPSTGPTSEPEKPKPEETDLPIEQGGASNSSLKDYPQPLYKGFLHIKCEQCGNEKSFFARIPTNRHYCECGNQVEIKDLRTAHVKCKCGVDVKYKTNIRDCYFSIPCFKCSAPVDLELNKTWTAYNTIQ